MLVADVLAPPSVLRNSYHLNFAQKITRILFESETLSDPCSQSCYVLQACPDLCLFLPADYVLALLQVLTPAKSAQRVLWRPKRAQSDASDVFQRL